MKFTYNNLPLKTVHVQMERDELLVLMWALEAVDDPEDPELLDDAYAIHQRLQAIWLEMDGHTK